MRTRLLILVTVAALVGPVSLASAQLWTPQSPSPSAQEHTDAFFLTPDHGWITGRDHVLMETFDGGRTWTQEPDLDRDDRFVDPPFHALDFVDALHGWVVGNEGWRTTDGGVTWQQMTGFPAGSYYHLDFVDTLHGWAGGNGWLFGTDDGGLTWTARTGGRDFGAVAGVGFRDAQVGVFANSKYSWTTESSGLYRTTDGGQSWTQVFTGGAGQVLWMTPNVVLATTSGGILRSTDAGQTWTTIPLSSFAPMEWSAAGTQSVVALSWSFDWWRSDDQGQTWTRVHPGSTYYNAFSDVQFLDGQHGFAAGVGYAARTDDGGQTWTQMGSGFGGGVNDLAMAAPDFGIAVGNGAGVARTEDGRNWIAEVRDAAGEPIGIYTHWSSVDVVDRDVAVIAGDMNVLRTRDGARSWEDISPSQIGGDVHDVEFVSADVGWAVGNLFVDPILLHTVDGGQTWVDQDPSNHMGALYAGDFRDANVGWVVGSGRYAWKTTDGGTNWVPYDVPIGSGARTEVAFAPDDPDVGWIAGAYGFLVKTDDGGITWNFQTLPGLPSNNIGVDIHVVDRDHAWAAVTSGDKAYSTDDGGTTWTAHRVAVAGYVTPSLTSIAADGYGHVWAAGWNGGIFVDDEPADGDVYLEPLPDFVRGAPVALETFGGVPGEGHAYLLSTTGTGAGPTPPQLGGLQLDILAPIFHLGTVQVGPDGRSLLPITIPPGAPLVDVHVQAAVPRTPVSAKTNVRSTPILP